MQVLRRGRPRLTLSRRELHVKPLTSAVGAEVSGVNLANMSAVDKEGVMEAFHRHSVIFFRDQQLDRAAHLSAARLFGEPETHAIVKGHPEFPQVIDIVKEAGAQTNFGETWHSDNSFQHDPSLGSVLYGVEVPAVGNDTMFCSMEAVYRDLSPGMQALLQPLSAIHTASKAFAADNATRQDRYNGRTAMQYDKAATALADSAVHPIVRTHPVTGRKSIYINSMFTVGIQGLTEAEGRPILDFLLAQVHRPEYQARFRWEAGSVAVWDNRCLQHMAINDNTVDRRVMRRVSVRAV